MTAVPEAFRRYGDEPLAQAPAFGPGKDGVLEATLVRAPGETTRLLADRVKVPYHLSGTLDDDPAPGLTTLCLQEPTGGVAQGDRHALDVTARERARVRLTTQSATKIHSMRANYAHVDATFRAGPDAHVEYVPGPTIINEDARCLRTVAVDLDPTASMILADVLVPDGLTGQEAFGFDHYHSRVEARCDDRLCCADTVDLRPADRDPQGPATLGDHGVVGSLYVFASSADASGLSDRIHERLPAGTATSAGVSALPYGAGVAVRVLGNRSADVTAAVRAAYDSARRELLGVGVPPDRRY